MVLSRVFRAPKTPTIWHAIPGITWLIVFGMLWFTAQAAATVIGALRTPQGVFIASDSQLSNEEGVKIGNFCKIRNFGSSVFAMTGFAQVDEVGFYPFDIARKHMTEGVTAKALADFELEVANGLLKAAKLEFAQRPAVYRERFINHDPMTAIFAWVTDGVAYMRAVGNGSV